jgi:hypothetical protein
MGQFLLFYPISEGMTYASDECLERRMIRAIRTTNKRRIPLWSGVAGQNDECFERRMIRAIRTTNKQMIPL